jgi:predicted N-acetyltransferase YhbS
MATKLTDSPDFVIRPLQTRAEVETFYRLNASVFRPDEDIEEVYQRRLQGALGEHNFHAGQRHGAFLGDTYVGGYVMRERTLCLESARLLTGCVGGVATHPNYRHQDIASVMMWDAVEHARDQHYALLLLHGIPNFYSHFGYTDVLEDIPRHTIDRTLILAQPVADCTVRQATLDDAETLLTLYQEHFGSYLGSFAPTRTIEQQQHFLRNWFEIVIPLLALDTDGKACGYLMLSRKQNKLIAFEVATNSWSAALVLLQHHARLLEAEKDSSAEISWPIPPSSITYYHIADHLPIRSEMYISPDRGWMAHPGHLPTLFSAIFPLWQQRWQESHPNWSGTLTFSIADFNISLELHAGLTSMVAYPSSPTYTIKLRSQSFLQLLFSFRPVSWIAQQEEVNIPRELFPIMETLFPPRQAWLSGSDAF